MGMGYVYMWVEGNDNLHDFCKKRFGEQPTFVEKTSGNAEMPKFTTNTSVTSTAIIMRCTSYSCRTNPAR